MASPAIPVMGTPDLGPSTGPPSPGVDDGTTPDDTPPNSLQLAVPRAQQPDESTTSTHPTGSIDEPIPDTPKTDGGTGTDTSATPRTLSAAPRPAIHLNISGSELDVEPGDTLQFHAAGPGSCVTFQGRIPGPRGVFDDPTDEVYFGGEHSQLCRGDPPLVWTGECPDPPPTGRYLSCELR